jgi:hypothetical protein
MQCLQNNGMLIELLIDEDVTFVLREGQRMIQLPNNHRVTYQLQYRKCGKTTCSTCREGPGHGPYWYAYWREGARLRSGYIGKVRPESLSLDEAMSAAGSHRL